MDESIKSLQEHHSPYLWHNCNTHEYRITKIECHYFHSAHFNESEDIFLILAAPEFPEESCHIIFNW